LTDSITGKKVEHTYPKGFVIDTGSYYHSSHKTVSCVKCHSEGYQKYPHPADLKNKPMPSCMDCHKENYDSYTKINFDAIDSAYRKSVHAVNLKEKFSCDYCHSQHYLKIGTVGAKDVEAIVDYDNKICLKCHDNAERYNRFVTSPMPDLAETHKWLPNFEFHLSAIRCIECHTAHSSGIDAQPTLPFSLHNKQRNEHFIMHNNSSQHSCVECHSGSPVVLQSLYKFKSKTENKDGFLNAPLIKNAFVIGANRNICLDIASIIIFVVLLCFILVHLWYRYRTKKHLIKPRQRVHSPPLLLLHWLNTIVFGLLVITGISMHYSGKKFQLIQFSTAVSVHTMCAIILFSAASFT
jgi:nitrate/TMAO reductase-like tetraheme cytochrome c subunit